MTKSRSLIQSPRRRWPAGHPSYDYTAVRTGSGVAAMRLRFLREAKVTAAPARRSDRHPRALRLTQAPPLGTRLGYDRATISN